MKKYTNQTDRKWREEWEKQDTNKVQHDNSQPKYYILDMFPYPSGAGLHVGHPLGYIATDIVARYKRLKGFNVLHPMGFDSFGLPAEQYAIQTGQHPADTTKHNIAAYRKQLIDIGLSFDWTREVQTSDPSFYRWTQWIFKQLFEAYYDAKADKAKPISELIAQFETSGNADVYAVCDEDTITFTANQWQQFSEADQQRILLKYRLTYIAETSVNWCPILGTVLSNDEVKDGFSERGGYPVEQRQMPQWCMRVSAYADRLLIGLQKLDWPEPIKDIQRNWIGKSEGVELDFQVHANEARITVYTTRIDTIGGVTFLVLAPENSLVSRITTSEQFEEVQGYVARSVNRTERARIHDSKNITGVFTGSYAINPLNDEKVPIWIADYVLGGYGTGAIMAVPAGDQRDYDFADHFDLGIVPIYEGTDVSERADPTKDGRLFNSGFLDGLMYEEAQTQATSFIEGRGLGRKKVHYRLKDAIFGRQRYWGEPIPICYNGNIPMLIDAGDLPLQLPEIDEYLPTSSGQPPLARAKDWMYQGNPIELSTMPGWAGSSWYFFRYMDPTNEKEFCSKENLEYWKDVDLYVGGSEHATGHLIYSRFWTKVLYDLGHVPQDEFAKKLVNQGMILGRSSLIHRVKGENTYVSSDMRLRFDTVPLHVDVNIVHDDVLDLEAFKKWKPDAESAKFIVNDLGQFRCDWAIEKMSKSKHNVVRPDDIVSKYGADTFRIYEMFLGPITQNKPWSTLSIEGIRKFLQKTLRLYFDKDGRTHVAVSTGTPEEKRVINEAIKQVEEDIDRLSFNTAISALMICVSKLTSLQCRSQDVLEKLAIILSPFAPHFAEEVWREGLGHVSSVHQASYPEVDEDAIRTDCFRYPITINGKLRTHISYDDSVSEEKIRSSVLTHDVVQKWTKGHSPKSITVVRYRIINIQL